MTFVRSTDRSVYARDRVARRARAWIVASSVVLARSTDRSVCARDRVARRARAWLVASAIAVLALGGCATVQPWERELLAHPAMAESTDPEGEAFDAHVRGAHEAGLDPGASGGGGCGCN